MDNYINFWDEQAEHNQEHVDVTQNFITDEVFNSRDHLLHWARQTGFSLGFILIITSSTKETVAGRKPKIVIECDRNGNYRAAKPSTMSTSTKKCNCPFRLRGEKLENGDEWKVRVICGFHNHSASLYMEGHPYPGRLSEEEIKLMMEMSGNLVPPRNILASIKKNNPNNVTSMKTLYNTRQKYQVYEHEGRSQMQQLMFQLNKHHYIWWQRTNNETNEVEDLFFAHPRSIDLVRAFPYILFMDATYKTNRFRIPFVQIVGVTSTEMTFSVAFAFIRSEKEENYFWALCCLRNVISGCLLPRVVLTDRDSALRKAINHVFPESTALLCTWHIGNNVATNCKGFFDKATWKKFNQMWYDIVDSETPEDYNLNLLKIEQVFDRYAQAITYIKTFDAIKEKFVAAWTNRSMNYGNRTTNRVEGQHARLKRYLGSSTGNFESVWEKVHSLLDAQFTTIKASLQKSRTYTRHDFKFLIFQNLLGFVSSAGLDYIVEEVKRSNNIGIDYRCGCQIRISHGLPCAHEIAVYRLEGRPIPLSAVDMYWKKLDFAPSTGLDDDDLNCRVELELFSTEFKKKPKPAKMRMLQKIREIINPSTTLVLEPEVKIQTRGRPSSKKKAEESTRRNPSAFEYVDNRDTIIVAGRHSCSSIQRFSGYQKKQQNSYIRQFPSYLHEYILSVNDVTPDGNCGFRAVALGMGCSEDAWIQVRSDMLDELNANEHEYNAIYGVYGRISAIRKALIFFDRDRPAPFDHWMDLPDMGYLIASRYNIVFVLISASGTTTFLPLRSAPPPPQRRRLVCIGHVNGNHFVKISLISNPPIPRPLQWHTFKHECAIEWGIIYEQNFNFYRQLVDWNSLNVTQQSVHLDSD